MLISSNLEIMLKSELTNSVFRLIYVEIFEVLICNFVAGKVLTFYLAWAGKCSWDMKILFCSALKISSQLLPWKRWTRGNQEI